MRVTVVVRTFAILATAEPEMTSPWLTRACVIMVVVAIATFAVDSFSAGVADNRRALSANRVLARLCDAILAADDDVIRDRKRKWGENTMHSWGKRDFARNRQSTALSICESLQRYWELVPAWKTGNGYADTKDAGWPGYDFGVDTSGDKYNAAMKRKWGVNSMESWGKRTRPQL